MSSILWSISVGALQFTHFEKSQKPLTCLLENNMIDTLTHNITLFWLWHYISIRFIFHALSHYTHISYAIFLPKCTRLRNEF